MGIKFAHSYDMVGTVAAPATLTATLTDNTKSVIIKDLANQLLGVSYIPKAAQTNRYMYLTIETNNKPDMSTIPTTGWKPYTCVYVSQSPNEVDLQPVVASIGGTFGTPIQIPGSSGSPVSTGGAEYRATYQLAQIAKWIRISAAESGTDNFGTAHIELAIQE